jgi:glutamyl-tRNA reductase
VSDHDTPTQRATINQLSVDELDAMLEGIRKRRLERVQKLEAIARVKADDAQLVSWLKFESAYKVAARYMRKFEEMEKKAEELIHKVRLRAMEVAFEVEDMNDAAD